MQQRGLFEKKESGSGCAGAFRNVVAAVAFMTGMSLQAAESTAATDGGHAGEAVMATAASIVPSHQLGAWLMGLVRRMMDAVGLSRSTGIEEVIYTALVLVVAIAIGMGIKWFVLWSVRKVVRLRHKAMGNELLAQKTFSKCSHFIPPLVFLCLIPFAFTSDHATLTWIMRIVGVYTLVTFGLAICAVLEFAWIRFDERENTENHPLKGVLNVCRGLVWIIIFIISVSVLLDKSPMTLLAGLGAFAAALMLIFKDSILGLVAGIQLSQNDMLRVGDWIVVPSTIANGIVMDVTLSVVKVQNWDNTMVMLPPYTLVSTSFQNWRNMTDVGARYINYNIYIDYTTVKPLTKEKLDELTEKFPLMKGFVEQLQEVKEKDATGNKLFAQIYNNTHGPNGTIDTNLGLYRAYACCYLIAHPEINTETQDMLMTMGTPTSYGVAINVNCYTRQTSWAQFAAVKAEVAEHLYTVAEDFGLKVYNEPDSNTYTLEASGNSTVHSVMAQPVSPDSAAAPQTAKGGK